MMPLALAVAVSKASKAVLAHPVGQIEPLDLAGAYLVVLWLAEHLASPNEIECDAIGGQVGSAKNVAASHRNCNANAGTCCNGCCIWPQSALLAWCFQSQT